MSTSTALDQQLVRCRPCGSLIFSKGSPCGTCHVLAIRSMPREWSENAPCMSIDPELWFPDNGTAPKQIVFDTCNSCPIRRECLRVGLQEREGIWAGYRPEERTKLRRITFGLTASQRNTITDQAALVGATTFLQDNR